MYKIIFVLTLAFQMPLGRGYDKQGFFYFKIMDIIDKKILKLFIDFAINEIDIEKAILKVRKICSKPQKREKCQCIKPIATITQTTICVKCDGWISMEKYPYSII